jgi:F-type H+-transporting ATPase subunit epsilon
MATITLEIVTAERLVFSEDVDVVVAPGIEGELAVLPHHAPLLTVLKAGVMRFRQEGKEGNLAVTGGFLEVMGEKVMVLADAAEHAEGINEERAQEAVSRAQERLANRDEDVDLERVLQSLQRAQVRLKVARRKGRGEGVPSRRPD